MRAGVLALIAALAASCATAPGTGFATLQPGTLSVPAPLASTRLTDQGRWKTSNGYALALDGEQLRLEGARVALQAPGAAAGAPGAGAKFDEANPPPGYGVCHGGHCHRDDGALVDYADVQAELDRAAGGGAAPPRTVASVLVAGDALVVPLKAASSPALAGCEPHCYLARGALSQAVFSPGKLVASGTVVPSTGGEPRAFTLALALPALPAAPFPAAAVTLQGPAGLAVAGSFMLTDKLFDGLPFARLLAAGPGPLDLGADKEAAETLVANFAKSAFSATVTPRP